MYSSHFTTWRQQLRAPGESGFDAKVAGRKPTSDDRGKRLKQLEREKAELERELRIARKLIDPAGKAREILGVALPSRNDDEKR